MSGLEAFTINGTSLDTYAFMLSDLSKVLAGPGPRGSNQVVPGRHGTIRTPRKRFDEVEYALPLWINGCLPDGSIPAGSTERAELFARRDELLRLLYADPLICAYTRPDGTTVQAHCEVSDVLDFTTVAAQPYAQVSVALRNPSAFWFDADPVSQTVTGVSGTVADLTAFADATAPITDLTITYSGPINNPTLLHGPSRFLTWNGVVASGKQLVINTGNWTVSPGTGTAWSPDLRDVSFGPGPSWLELDPTLSSFQITLNHTAAGSASVTLTARRAYLSA